RQVDALTQSMETRQSRQFLWDVWQKVWTEATCQREPPKKPAKEKKSLLGKLKKQDAKPGWMGEQMTMEEWEDAVAMIAQANKRAAANWAGLTAASDAFAAPTDGDNKMLMNLFARTPDVMGKQVRALTQIAEQGGNRAKIFADYQQGKDIDLPLLSAVCQRPDLFPDGGILKDVMRSFPEPLQRDQFGLIVRYFADDIA
ncbi:MAG: hypothetical protein VW405_10865, partial [Rhodospirillaceae bacterium]